MIMGPSFSARGPALRADPGEPGSLRLVDQRAESERRCSLHEFQAAPLAPTTSRSLRSRAHRPYLDRPDTPSKRDFATSQRKTGVKHAEVVTARLARDERGWLRLVS
jgi:hypothetical protein